MLDNLEAGLGRDGAAAPEGLAVYNSGQISIELDPPRGKPGGLPMTVSLAEAEDHRTAANRLLNRCYSRRGYGSHHQLPRHESCASFSAAVEGQVIGTLTLTADSPAGLSLDQTFAEELDLFRSSPGTHLCELTKFAFDASGSSLPYLASLFHVIFLFGTQRYNCTDLFIEVNPRHVRFYEAMLRFRRVGELKTNPSVNAPAQLMWLKVSEVRRLIDEHAGGNGTASRSLYPYFFSEREAQVVAERLAGFGRQPVVGPSALVASPALVGY